jgi:hypothetical protein
LRCRGGNFDAEARKTGADPDDEPRETQRQQRQPLQRPQPARRRRSSACGLARRRVA